MKLKYNDTNVIIHEHFNLFASYITPNRICNYIKILALLITEVTFIFMQAKISRLKFT